MSIDNLEDGLGYHIYYKVLNTKNFGIPQNRERIFIVGFKDFRNFSFPKEIPLELRLKDILETEVVEKYYLSDKAIKLLKQKQKFNKFNPLNGSSTLAACLSARCNKVSNDNNFITTHSLHPRSGDPTKGGTGHLSKTDGTAYCLDTGNAQAVELNAKIRRLTPLECWRLQGFKDADFNKVKDVSDTQLYKQAGNSITVDVLMHLFQKIYG